MARSARLDIEGSEYQLPLVQGSEAELGIDISELRGESGAITLDPAYKNTGACESSICYIDGEAGILRYRGYPHTMLHEDLRHLYSAFPKNAPPMAVCAAVTGALSSFYPDDLDPDDARQVEISVDRLIAKFPTIAAYSYKHSLGQPFLYPDNSLGYVENFLRMMFGTPCEPYLVDTVVARALDVLLILHADHEQNCSTSTVRLVGSSHANIFASMAAGIMALWGPRHGGANMDVIRMLESIADEGLTAQEFVDRAKDRRDTSRLMGFGHRVYKNFDPRAKIIKKSASEVLERLGVRSTLLEIAVDLERIALEDEYFIERKLYPNVDFYSGVIFKAIGLPTTIFTALFAMGRLPGWIAHWSELHEQKQPIGRPRQIYVGPTLRPFAPIAKR
jgi:citrate synthase